MGRLLLITGGARSGKSMYAQVMAGRAGARVGYIATARVLDGEMRARVARHQQQRPGTWRTFEAPLYPQEVLRAGCDVDVYLLDCLTMLVSNLLLGAGVDWEGDVTPEQMGRAEACVQEGIGALLAAVAACERDVIVVTNEVGDSIVPMGALARQFRDCVGLANQRMARQAACVCLMACGLPLWLKGSEEAWAR
nr:bifunctional adenosylcobinamide kinase/adenosylcobinamide-phosphate guanylyltransferase [Maliibacterium massiliense]